jgi:thiol-disulfide isomerase/thioredoxin
MSSSIYGYFFLLIGLVLLIVGISYNKRPSNDSLSKRENDTLFEDGKHYRPNAFARFFQTLKKHSFFLGFCLALLIGFFQIGYSYLFLRPAPVVIEKAPPRLLELNFTPAFGREPKVEGPFVLTNPENLMKDLKDYEKDISDFSDKITIIHYWATWCEPCLKEMPEFAKFAQNHKDTFTIIPMSMPLKTEIYPGESIVAFYKKNNIENLPIALDIKGKLRKSMRLRSLPTTVFMAPNGQEIGRIEGSFEWSEENIALIYRELLKKDI